MTLARWTHESPAAMRALLTSPERQAALLAAMDDLYPEVGDEPGQRGTA